MIISGAVLAIGSTREALSVSIRLEVEVVGEETTIHSGAPLLSVAESVGHKSITTDSSRDTAINH